MIRLFSSVHKKSAEGEVETKTTDRTVVTVKLNQPAKLKARLLLIYFGDLAAR